MGSTYGTAVNGRYVQDWYALSDGDRIQLGDAFIVFHAQRQMDAYDAQTPPHGFPAVAHPAMPPATSPTEASLLAPNMVRCPYCGTANLKANTHCFNCGKTLWRTEQVALVSPQRKTRIRAAATSGTPDRVSPWITALLIVLVIVIIFLLSLLIGLALANFRLGS